MKLILDNFSFNPSVFMRSAGYALDKKTNDEVSYMRRISGLDYPRYHAYTRIHKTTFTINLHIDQKKPSYEGSVAHSGDYSSPLIEQELIRIKKIAEEQ